MHYRELLRGVNAYATDGKNSTNAFPAQLYEEELITNNSSYFDFLAGDRPFVDRVVEFLKLWNIPESRFHPPNRQRIQTVYNNIPHDALGWVLQDLSLWEHKGEIIQIFYDFIDAVKYTGASKALHIFNPKFFMMWDYNIRYGYGCAENEEGYFNFLYRSQKEIKEIILTYANDYPSGPEISQQIYRGKSKSILKLLDEYNIAKYTKGWI